MTDHDDDELTPEILAALGAPLHVDPVIANRQIDAALAHFDALGDDRSSPSGGADVTPLHPRRHPARWAAAAAAVVVAVGGVWLAGRHSTTTTTQTADRAQSSGSAGSARAAAPSSDAFSSAGSTTSPPPSSPAPEPESSSKANPAADQPPGADTTVQPSPPDALHAPSVSQSLSPSRSYGVGGSTASAGAAQTCPAPHLRAALVSIGTTTAHGRQELVLRYASGPQGERVITVRIDPSTCARH